MASASTVSLEKRTMQRRQSCDTVCSSNSSCILQKRKPVHPLAGSMRPFLSRSVGSNSVVKQRVLSARFLKLRSLQNQLNDAQFHISELQQENRALKTLQKRQDRALSKYEGTSADLPKLLQSHQEEIRILEVKNKLLRKSMKDIKDQLKTREDELVNVREQLKNLTVLAKDKHLADRHMLSEQVTELREKLKHSEAQINLLNRKLMLESKNCKYKLNSEISKHRQHQKDLLQALSEIDRLTAMLETKEKGMPMNGRKRFFNLPQRQAVSMTSLGETKLNTAQEIKLATENVLEACSVPAKLENSIVKLHPISSDTESKGATTEFPEVTLTSPSESVKARLSASKIGIEKGLNQISSNLQKVNFSDSDVVKHNFQLKSSITPPRHGIIKSRPSSAPKLEKIQLQPEIKTPASEKADESLEQRLGECCTSIFNSVQDCNTAVDQHTETFEQSKTETAKLIESLKEVDVLDSKLRHLNFFASDLEIDAKDVDLANTILKDEFSFQRDVNKDPRRMKKYDFIINSSDNNGNLLKNTPSVADEDKTKLLAALKAIDNGENVETIDYTPNDPSRKIKLMKELFGDVGK